MSERLLPEQRVKQRKTIQNIFKKGKSAKGAFVNLWVYSDPETSLSKPQLGVMVSKKTNDKSVKRNLWKRRIREIFRKNQAKIKKNSVVLVVTKKERIDPMPDYKTLEEEIFTLLSKTNSLK